MTLVDVLAQSLPSLGSGAVKIPGSIPEPYSTMAKRCLEIDARQRATVGEIRELMKRPAQTASGRQAVPEGTNHRELPGADKPSTTARLEEKAHQIHPASVDSPSRVIAQRT